MKKAILSILLALLVVLSALPMSAFAAENDAAVTAAAVDAADAGATIYSASDANHLRSYLQTNGDITVNLTADIEFTMPEGYQWSMTGSNNDTAYWTVVARGKKTINLNGHRLYLTDNMIEKTRYNDEILVMNGYRRYAYLFRIPTGAYLTVNGTQPNSEIMFDAQMPAYDQLMDYQVATQRSLFEVCGGELTLNGGEYQAGRRKTVWVTSALMKKKNWQTVDGVLWNSTHYYGNGEYCIGGSVIVAKVGEAHINGGTLIGHGYSIDEEAGRNAVLRSTEGNIYVIDADVRGYCGADAFHADESERLKMLSGTAITYAPEWYLFPYGFRAVSTESNYCAVAVGAGNSVAWTMSWCDVETVNDRNNDMYLLSSTTTYTPKNCSEDVLRWYDRAGNVLSTGDKTYYIGSGQEIIFDFPYTYFPSEEIPGVTHSVKYYWSLSKKTGSGSWSSVTGWQSSQQNNTVDLSSYKSLLTDGTTYRMSARMEEAWSSAHSYTWTVTASKSLTFTAVDYVIDAIGIHINSPTSGQALTFDTAKVYGVPEHVRCTDIRWYKSNGSRVYSGTSAAAGEAYEVWVKLTPDVGRFAARSTLSQNTTLNFKQASINVEDDSVWVRYKFPATAKIIGSVTLTVTEPRPGATPSYHIDCAHGTYGVWDAEDTVQWMVSSDGSSYSTMSPTAKFVAGKYYKLYVDLKAKSGYIFAVTANWSPDVSAAVNGSVGRVIKTYEQDPEEIITVEYTIPALSAQQPEQITAVSVTIPEPAAGDTLSYSAVLPSGAHYKRESYTSDNWVSGVCWADENGKDIRADSGAVFEPGKQYTITVSLVPTDAQKYEFAESGLSAAVNGEPAKILVYEAKKVIFVMYTFTIPAAPAGYIVGDADADGKITILDATAIQRYLASLPVVSFDANAADADEDGKITILDATAIQRHLAALSTNPNIGKNKA